jgi:hypothetical protein
MADNNIPADWVLLEAAKRASFSQNYALAELRLLAKGDGSFPALCDMIAKYERPPVDEATELWAQLLEVSDRPHGGRDARVGKPGDNEKAAIAHLRAHLAKVRAEKVS